MFFYTVEFINEIIFCAAGTASALVLLTYLLFRFQKDEL